MAEKDATLDRAYAACARLARRHYENFPVASWLLPRHMRPHVAAVYAFARLADDFADEGHRLPAERHVLLDDWLARLGRCINGAEEAEPNESGPLPSTSEVFLALGHTIRICELPVTLLEDLVSAFRQDIDVRRYATWDELLDYCRRSANPVGRLVLRIAGFDRPALDASSDALCTALQLTNFWQDLQRDWLRGRLYVPLTERDACNAEESDLDRGLMTAQWRCALQRASATTRALFAAGRTVCDGVGGRLRFELRLTWLGGSSILDRLEACGFDVFTARPTIRARDVVPLAVSALRWSPAP